MIIELIYFILGFGISKLTAGSEFPSLKFGKIHIHHWVWSIILTLLFLILGDLLWIFFLGITVQGLSYVDRFNFSSSR